MNKLTSLLSVLLIAGLLASSFALVPSSSALTMAEAHMTLTRASWDLRDALRAWCEGAFPRE